MTTPANEKTLCFVCGNHEWKPYFSSKEYPQYTYKRCGNCKFIQLTPLPSQEELNKFYAGLWSEHKTDSYGDRFVNRDLPDEATIQKWYAPSFSQWEEFLPPSQNTRRLLEVGVGRGNILAAAKALGWDSVGVDVSEQGAKRLVEQHNFKVIVGDFCTSPLDDIGKVDVVHMNHVLEHMRDPGVALEQVKRILKPNGLFCFAVPTIDEKLFNITSTLWKLLYNISGHWNGFHPYFWCLYSIGHISCFSANTINRFLAKHDFIVQWEKYSLPRWERTESWLRHIRGLSMEPFFLLTNSGWEIRVIAQFKKNK